MNILKSLKSIFVKSEIEFKSKLWKTENCFECGNPYDKNSFWAEFTEINGKVYQVPICNNCSENNCEHKIPTVEES